MSAEVGSDGFEIGSLLSREAFPHEVREISLLETHISWVVLTGVYAYKIKKPVQFDFVDYSTLELRKQFCLKELELNRRFAPEMYLNVLPIRVVDGQTVIGKEPVAQMEADKSNPPIEYAVQMREFPQDAIVAARLQDPSLTLEVVEQLGKSIATFHDSIESAIPIIECVQPENIVSDAQANFSTMSGVFADNERDDMLNRLESWTKAWGQRLEPKFARRLHCGCVRLCHGDMHLKNIVQLEGRLVPFDGIEFNEEFQWIDQLSEIAFPVLDFAARGRPDLAWRLLNSYLEATGDYEDLDVLRFYLVYRAMVRAKVTWLNPKNRLEKNSDEAALVDAPVDQFAGPWDKYLETATDFAFGVKPKLSIAYGFSGSGKSFMAMKFVEQEGGIRIRSDAERHRLAKKFRIKDKYSKAMTEWVYFRLLELARSAIEAEMPVVVDAAFLHQSCRGLFQDFAAEAQVEYQIIHCDAPFEELCRRIRNRGADPSDANLSVLKMQMESHEPLTTDELQYATTQS